MPKGKKTNLLPEVDAYGLSNKTKSAMLKKSMYTPEWWRKSSGKAEMTDSPIDMVLMGGPVKMLSKMAGAAAKEIEKRSAMELEQILSRTAGKRVSGAWDELSPIGGSLLKMVEHGAMPAYGIGQAVKFAEPEENQYCRGGKMYFLGSDLSFGDAVKQNPSQLQPMGQASVANPGLAPNNHPSAASNDPSASPLAKGALNAVMPGAGEILGAVSGATNSLVNMFDKSGGSMIGAAIKGTMSGNPLGAPMAMMQLQQQRKEEQRLYNQASLSNYAAGTQDIDPSMHTYALGGPMLTEFNVGGSHEANPNGGIQQGMNRDNGEPNLVEEGETKSNKGSTKDYIFPARSVFTNPKEYNLGGSLAGLSFADAHKKISEYSKERPNDPIAARDYELKTVRLKQANEDLIAMKQFEDTNPQDSITHANSADKLGERMFKYGGFIFKDI